MVCNNWFCCAQSRRADLLRITLWLSRSSKILIFFFRWKHITEWRLWRDNRLPTQGRDTKFEAASIADLKKALLLEQGRKERAIASLRELELKRESESLVPQSEASETIIKTLTPLPRLLDALPRLVAASANPENPMIAELAIRNGLDERVFAEMQKISLGQD